MPERMRRLNCREIEAILSRHDFELISQRGSHRKWRNAERRLQVVVPEHGGRQLPLGTLRTIMTTAEIPDSEWKA